MLIDIKFDQKRLDKKLLKMKNYIKEQKLDVDILEFRSKLEDFFIRLKRGIYLTNLNFEHDLEEISNIKIDYDHMYQSFSPKSWEDVKSGKFDLATSRENFGVCDNYKQILKRYPELKHSDRNFIVSLTPIKKSDEPSNYGWRWEKWGKYIGHQKVVATYLANEPFIDEIYVYHIFEIDKKFI